MVGSCCPFKEQATEIELGIGRARLSKAIEIWPDFVPLFGTCFEAVLLLSAMMPAFAKPGAPAAAAAQAQTASQGASSKSAGAKAASKSATAQSNASTNPQSANQENNSPNTGSNNPGIAPAGWVPQSQNQQMRAGSNRTTIPNQKGMKPAATPNSKEKKPANDGIR